MLWGLVALSAAAIAAVSALSLLTSGPETSSIPLGPDPEPHYASLLVHGLPGALALAIGPFQFVTRLRVRHPRLHRIAGRVYLASVVVGAVAALVAVLYSVSGFTVRVAFSVLAAAWLYTAFRAYRTIRRGEVQQHRIWMIRNYALTFAAVMLRVYTMGGIALQESVWPWLTFDDVYVTAAWASVLVNVLVVEYFIVNRTPRPSARRRPRHDAAAGVGVAVGAGVGVAPAGRDRAQDLRWTPPPGAAARPAHPDVRVTARRGR